MLQRRTGKVAGTLCTVAFFLSACNGPSNTLGVLPAGNASTDAASAPAADFIVTIPHKSPGRPRFVSPATQSLSIVVSTLSGKPVLTKNADTTQASPGCTKISGGTRCTIRVSLAAGSYAAGITAYSEREEKGSVLSRADGVPFTLKAGGSRQVAFTMDGVPKSFRLTPASSAITGSTARGFVLGPGTIWGGAQTFFVAPIDAAGNAIVGAGSPRLTIESSSDSFSLVQPASKQQSFSITPPQHVTSASTQLTVKASYADKAICTQPGASCVQAVEVTFAPYANDDWIAFAHDFARTGFEGQNTGISASTVSTLKQRWKLTLPYAVYSSPVAYNGSVIVASYQGVVYNLSANDGSVIWKTNIATHFNELLRSSPMIDTDDGLVIMGTWYNTGGDEITPHPSALYALRLNDGSVAWQLNFNGMVHAAPVYANGVVYEGWSGGDQPYCINGGVDAIDSNTGAVRWTWLTNPFTNPGGGGGVWGALAWDGSHLVFGTGNTCQGEAWDQGAVALNPNGSMAWHFQADPTYDNDNDSGGGVLIQNGTATFLNKNGSLYTLNGTTGQQILATALGGSGGHGTPTSDGSVVVVGAGFFPTSGDRSQSRVLLERPHDTEPGFSSYLKGVSSTGTVLWSLPMNASIDSYAAINNGVVFAGMDNELDAISLQSGTILFQIAGAGTFTAGPVIVPSGLYAADYAGNVYAYSLP